MKMGLENERIISSRQLILLRDISSLSAELNMPCYLVGGSVRDILLEQPINDLDIVLEANAIEFGNALVKKIGGRLTTHPKFHTAIWHLPESLADHIQPSFLDLITARSETYKTPGALPTVTPSTMEDDLRRRDFTINAMAIRLDGDHFGELLDPLNGQSDLKYGLIRILHPRSFIDDPTRIFRAIRYEGRYSFHLESSTSESINSTSLDIFRMLSGERIRHELDLIFEEEQALSMIQRLQELDTFKYIHQKLPDFNPAYSDFLEMDMGLDIPASRAALGYILWLMDLNEDAILSISRRLEFTSELTHSVWAASQLKKSLPFLTNSKPSLWALALEKLPLLSVYVVYLDSGEGSLLNYISFWRHVKPHTTGNDLKAHGLPLGPRYGEILTQLRAAWLDGEITNEKEEKELLNTLL